MAAAGEGGGARASCAETRQVLEGEVVLGSEADPAAAALGRKARVAWSEALGRRICRRVAAGEHLYTVLRAPGMPTPQCVGRWAKERPAFGRRLEAARAAGGRPLGGGGVWRYSDGLAGEVLERICEGESLTAIGGDPTMPCLSTLFYWRRNRAGFDQEVQTAMRVRAERMADLGWEMVQAATPETAYLTHVRMTHLRWMAAAMAPRVYRTKLVEPEAPREVKTVLFRHFTVEVDPETGEKRSVAYCPNPYTGAAEREDTPGWVQPGGPDVFSMPGGRQGGQPAYQWVRARAEAAPASASKGDEAD